jgi:hypothetical protein
MFLHLIIIYIYYQKFLKRVLEYLRNQIKKRKINYFRFLNIFRFEFNLNDFINRILFLKKNYSPWKKKNHIETENFFY